LSEQKRDYLLLLDTHPEHHYALRRTDAIIRALKGRGNSKLLDIYECIKPADREIFHSGGVREKQNYLANRNLLKFNEQLLEIIERYKFDILIMLTICDYRLYLLPDTLKKLREQEKFVVGVLGDEDIPENFDEYCFWLPLFDRVVPYTTEETRRFNEIHPNAIQMLESADMISSGLEEDIPWKYSGDCIFLGAPNPVRVATVEKLLDNGINIHVYGNKRWLKHKKVREVYQGFPSNADYDRVLTGYTILMGFMEDSSGLVHINAKLFDAARSNMFVIMSYYPPFVHDYGLVEGEDIVMYRSPSDLVDKINYYLYRPIEREQIANNLARKIKNGFDYGDLYAKLFDQLEAAQATCIDKAIDKNILTFVVPYEARESIQIPGSNVIYVSKKTTDPDGGIIRYCEFLQRYNELITSDYVIFARPGVRYQESIIGYMSFLIKHYDFNRAVFQTHTENRALFKLPFLYDSASVIWTKDEFRKVFKQVYRSKTGLVLDWKHNRTIQVQLFFNYIERSIAYSFIFDTVFNYIQLVSKLINKLKSYFRKLI
jgi:hypothetical protein